MINTFLIWYNERMSLQNEYPILCPYCGQSIGIMVDQSIGQQQYVEDCQICCRPITFHIDLSDRDDPLIEAQPENG